MPGPQRRYSTEVRARAVRMVLEHRDAHPSESAAINSIADKIGCNGPFCDHVLLRFR
jgi:transposase